jgi:tRNA-uridine 2-sulfurtransferase
MTLRVLAAMSGGVDSAVAAARAVEAGHDVTGVHLALSRNPSSYRTGARGCCTLEDARDARRAADVLGIPFYVWDLAERFHADVVEDFVSEYASGRTPNPCLRCNEKIKFAAVLDRALALDFDAVCTGHYARLVDGAGGRELHRAVDPEKDQSYVLGVLTEADRRGLAVADKPDSHDICFIADGDTSGFLSRQLGEAPGRIVSETGEVLGEHQATYGFTVGQRKGLRIGRPADDGKPRYVLSIEPVSRTVTVGPKERLAVGALTGLDPKWCGPALTGELEGRVQVRAHGTPLPARARLDGDTVRVELLEPAMGVAPGQAAVLYDGTRVVGSATISATEAAAAHA